MIVKTTTMVFVVLIIASTLSFFIPDKTITGMVSGIDSSNKDPVLIGEIFINYNKELELNTLNYFYNNLKLFSEDLIKTCKNDENKDVCVNKKISEAKNFKLVIDDCVSKNHAKPLDLSEISKNIRSDDERFVPDYGLYFISGYVQEILNEADTTKPSVILLKQFDDSLITIVFEDLLAKPLISSSEGKFLEVTGRIKKVDADERKITLFVGDRSLTPKERWEYIFVKTSSDAFSDSVVKIGDCALSPNVTCLCNVDFSVQGEITFFDNELIFNEESFLVPVNFFGMDTRVSESINKYVAVQTQGFDFSRFTLDGIMSGVSTDVTEVPANYVEVNPAVTRVHRTKYLLNENTNKIVFKKDFSNGARDFILVSQSYDFDNNKENLQECDIVERHFLFCASPLNWGSTQIEKDYAPSIKFALKI